VGLLPASKQLASDRVATDKRDFCTGTGKLMPVLGGFISGTVTMVSFLAMSKRLRNDLETLHRTRILATHRPERPKAAV